MARYVLVSPPYKNDTLVVSTLQKQYMSRLCTGSRVNELLHGLDVSFEPGVPESQRHISPHTACSGLSHCGRYIIVERWRIMASDILVRTSVRVMADAMSTITWINVCLTIVQPGTHFCENTKDFIEKMCLKWPAKWRPFRSGLNIL